MQQHPADRPTAAGRLIWAIGVTIIAVILLACGVAIWDLHREAITQQRSALQNLGVVLAEQTTRHVQVVDLVLQEMLSRVTASGVRTPDEFAAAFATRQVREFLRERLENLPEANSFALVTAEGRLLVTSRGPVSADFNFSDRDYYRHLTEHDDFGLFISGPVISRLTGTPAVYLARRINGPDRTLLGLAVGAIDIRYLVDFYRAIDLPPGEVVTLLHRDGVVLVRYPDSPAPAQDTAVVSTHPLHAWPLVVNVSIMEKVALATWRRQATIIAAGGIGSSVGFAVLFGIIGQQFRRKAEQNARLAATAAALRISEARIRDFAEMSSDWLWALDAELRFTWVSASEPLHLFGMKQRLGLTPWDAFGANLRDPGWAELRTTLLERRRFRDFRDVRTDCDGRSRHLSINGNPVFDARGVFTGYLGTGRDITSEVDAEQALLIAKERAETANRAKSEFLTNMSHELRTPLNAIIGFSELIHDQPFGRIATTYVEYASDINAAGHHLLDVINDVLDLSKIESGRYQLADEAVDLGMVVRASVSMLKLRAEAGNVRVEHVMNPTRLVVRGDGRALKQVTLNLLANAIKFTLPGGKVTLLIEAADNGPTLVVQDTGIGIEPAAVQFLCEPFRQADASINRRFGGSGLGLAISRKLLALHGGSLRIDSVVGEGTTVRATLPRERVIAAAPVSWPLTDSLASTGPS